MSEKSLPLVTVPHPGQLIASLFSFVETAEKKTYAIRIAWRGLPTKTIPVQFADEASAVFCAIRDDGGFGASDMKQGCGDLLDTAGNVMGRISYNGKIWIGAGEESQILATSDEVLGGRRS